MRCTTAFDIVARLVRETLHDLCADGNVREEGAALYPYFMEGGEQGQTVGVVLDEADIPEGAIQLPGIILDVVSELPGRARDLFEASDLFTDDDVMLNNQDILAMTGAIVVPDHDGDVWEVEYVGGRCPACGARTMRMVYKGDVEVLADMRDRFDLCLNEKCAKRIAGDGYTMPSRP
jgi:hypothetical protein